MPIAEPKKQDKPQKRIYTPQELNDLRDALTAFEQKRIGKRLFSKIDLYARSIRITNISPEGEITVLQPLAYDLLMERYRQLDIVDGKQEFIRRIQDRAHEKLADGMKVDQDDGIDGDEYNGI